MNEIALNLGYGVLGILALAAMAVTAHLLETYSPRFLKVLLTAAKCLFLAAWSFVAVVLPLLLAYSTYIHDGGWKCILPFIGAAPITFFWYVAGTPAIGTLFGKQWKAPLPIRRRKYTW